MMIALYILLGFVIYGIGCTITAWGMGRLTRIDGDEPAPFFVIAFWPLCLLGLVIGAPIALLSVGPVFMFKRGRAQRQIAANRKYS